MDPRILKVHPDNLSHDIIDYIEEVPNEVALANAEHLLCLLDELEVAVWYIGPSTIGGVLLAWRPEPEGKLVRIVLFNEGEVWLEPVDWRNETIELAGVRDLTLDVLSTFLKKTRLL